MVSGCPSLPSPFSTCSPDPIDDCRPSAPITPASCPHGEQQCPLGDGDTCIKSSEPCLCSSSALESSEQCVGGNRPASEEPTYSLTGQVVVKLPEGDETAIHRVYVEGEAGTIRVGEFHLIGIQFEGDTPPIVCEEDLNSKWQQSVVVTELTSWSAVGYKLDVANSTWLDNYVCQISAIYSFPQEVAISFNIAHMPFATEGIYTFSVNVTNSIGIAVLDKFVDVLEEIKGFELLDPQINIEGYILIEAGATNFLFVIEDGNYARLESQDMEAKPKFHPSCPEPFKNTSPCSTILANEQYTAAPLELQATDAGQNFTVLSFIATNTAFNQTMDLSLLVQERISDLKLVAREPPVKVGMEARLKFKVQRGSHMTFTWSESCDQRSGTMSESELSLTFTQPGICTFEVDAENLINSESGMFDIMVCTDTIASDLSLDVPAIVEVNTDVTITAYAHLNQFSCMWIVFDFGDDSERVFINHEEENGGASIPISVVHRFGKIGESNVTVTLLDSLDNSTLLSAVSKVTINQRITEVEVVADANPLATGVEHEFVANKKSGSGTIYYSFDMGDGTVFFGTEMTIRHSYDQVGTYDVRVTVSNNISEVSSSISVETLDPVTELELETVPPTLQGETVTFTAAISSGTNAQFQYYINGEEQQVQDTGEMQYLCSELGQYNITITVFNAVSRQYRSFMLYVVDSTTLDILLFGIDKCVEVDISATYTANMIHFKPEILYYEWEFGDGETTSEEGAVSVDHTYTTVGKFSLQVTASDDFGNQTSTSTEICTQERITGFTASHNGPIPLQKEGIVTVEMSSAIATGTDVKYKWDFQDGGEFETENGEYEFETAEAKTYSIEVTAYNDVNSEQSVLEMLVCETISGLIIQQSASNGYVAVDEAQNYQVSLVSGSHLQYIWTVDSTEVSTSPNMQYTFSTLGSHEVSLKVQNPVGSQTAMVTLIAQQPITDVALSPSISAGMPNQPVTFSVTYSKGSDVEYQWKVCDSCDTIIGTEEQIHSYTEPGEYNVTVTVFNKVSTSNTTVQIHIYLPITGLQIEVADLTQSRYVMKDSPTSVSIDVDENVVIETQEWTIKSDYGTITKTSRTFEQNFTDTGIYNITVKATNAIDDATTFLEIKVLEQITELEIVYTGDRNLSIVQPDISLQASIVQGSGVSFSWEVTFQESQSIVKTNKGVSVDVTFPQVGGYIITLQASNVFGIKTAEIDFDVFQPIGNAQMEVLDILTFPYLPAFEPVQFIAHSDASEYEDTTYKWQFKDTAPPTRYSVRSPVHTYDLAGESKVHLVIKNPISTDSIEEVVYVQEKIKELTINSASSAVLPGEVLSFEATFTEGTDVFYDWTVSNATHDMEFFNGSNVFDFAFQYVGSYTMKVVAKNKVSQQMDLKIIKVEERVERLSIVECCDYVFQYGHEVVLTANVAKGTNVEYNWTVMDHHAIEYSGPQMRHDFSAAGVYDVGVTAFNALNSETLWIKVKVDNPILSVRIVSDNNLVLVHEGEFLNFSAVVTGGEPVDELDYEWILNDEMLEFTTQHITLNFTQGEMVLEVTAANNVSSKSDSVSFTVYEAQCDSPELTPSSGTKRSELRSRSVEFEITVEACIWNVLNHDWKVFEGVCNDNPLEDEVPLPDNVTVTTPSLMIPARILNYGQYCVVFTSSFNVIPMSSTVHIDLNILPSLLQAIIEGGSTRMLAASDKIILDGQQSFDPDIKRAEDQQLEYTWTCSAKVRM